MGRDNGIINNRRVRKALVEKFKDIDGVVRCCSCGSNDNIEWHHAIPIAVGGKDVFTNLVPACHSCHVAAHSYGEHMQNSVVNREPNIKSGRKILVPENYKDLLNDYVYCRIGKIELGRLWNKAMGKDDGEMPDAIKHLSDKVWYKDYLNERGIEKVHNGIDAHCGRGDQESKKLYKLKNDAVLGTITYSDGRVEEIKHTGSVKPVVVPKSVEHDSLGFPQNYRELLTDFTFGKIGFKELLSKWDVAPQSPTSLVNYKNKAWYKAFLDELGIARATNKIDKPSATDIKNGVVGYIVFKSGKVMDLYR